MSALKHGREIYETSEMVALREAIHKDCGEYKVAYRGMWGHVLGHWTQSSGVWWFGRWELLCWELGFSNKQEPFGFSECRRACN